MKTVCFFCHKSCSSFDELKVHIKNYHGAEHDIDLLMLLQVMTENEKGTLRNQLEERVSKQDYTEESLTCKEAQINDVTTSNVANKVMFWNYTLNKDEPSQDQADDTIDMFNEILIANDCDHTLNESVEEKFRLLEQSDRNSIKEPVLAMPAESKTLSRKKPASSSKSKRKIQLWRFFDFEFCTTSFTLY